MSVTRRITGLLILAMSTAAQAQREATLPKLFDVEEYALKHPTPPFPKAARAKHIHGFGVFVMDIDVDSGQVIDVTVITSTGSKLLDQSAVETLRRWEFRPHTVKRVKVPITFTYPPKHSSNQSLEPLSSLKAP
jgi:TonB family protein